VLINYGFVLCYGIILNVNVLVRGIIKMEHEFPHACGCIETATCVNGGTITRLSKECNYHFVLNKRNY